MDLRFYIVLLMAILWASPVLNAQQLDQSKSAVKDTSEKPEAAAPAGQETPGMNYKYEARGRRDPFRSLDVTTSVQAASAPIVRPPGLKGQLVSEINLVGIVKEKGAYMAMATGYHGKTFFIHPNDELYDGKIVEIRNDEVILTQFLTDSHGKKVTQQVIKKLYPTRGEGKDAK